MARERWDSSKLSSDDSDGWKLCEIDGSPTLKVRRPRQDLGEAVKPLRAFWPHAFLTPQLCPAPSRSLALWAARLQRPQMGYITKDARTKSGKAQLSCLAHVNPSVGHSLRHFHLPLTVMPSCSEGLRHHLTNLGPSVGTHRATRCPSMLQT